MGEERSKQQGEKLKNSAMSRWVLIDYGSGKSKSIAVEKLTILQ
jgi:hypothetical protein